jgi:hypothetical protein
MGEAEVMNRTAIYLKPNDTRSFRITVDSVPQGWNQQMPELKIATVTPHP